MKYAEELIDRCGKGDYEQVARILREDPTQIHAIYSDSAPTTALHTAAHHGHLEIVKLLLDRGAEIHRPGDHGLTPLHCAAERGHVPVIHLLLERGADINALDGFKRTPLRAAAYSRDSDADAGARALLACGAQLDLQSALAMGMTDEVRAMLRSPDAVASAPDPKLILLDAVIFINGKVQVHYNENQGKSSREELCQIVQSHLDIVDAIVSQNPAFDANSHLAALFYALQLPTPLVAERLLKHRSDLRAAFPQQNLARVAARNHYCPAEMTALLTRYGVK